jgi:hypothetical protein
MMYRGRVKKFSETSALSYIPPVLMIKMILQIKEKLISVAMNTRIIEIAFLIYISTLPVV